MSYNYSFEDVRLMLDSYNSLSLQRIYAWTGARTLAPLRREFCEPGF